MDKIDLKKIIHSCVEGQLLYFDIIKDKDRKERTKKRVTMCKTNCKMYVAGVCNPLTTGKVEVDFVYKGNGVEEKRKEGEEYTGCGCNINCKSSLTENQCPLGKWENL